LLFYIDERSEECWVLPINPHSKIGDVLVGIIFGVFKPLLTFGNDKYLKFTKCFMLQFHDETCIENFYQQNFFVCYHFIMYQNLGSKSVRENSQIRQHNFLLPY